MPRLIKYPFYSLIGLLLAVGILSFTPYAYLIKGGWATYLHGDKSATIDDKRFFDTEVVRAEKPWEWPMRMVEGFEPEAELDSALNSTETAAFAVFHRDTLKYERYAEGYSAHSRTNSFSMAKTITAMITQIAIESGFIEGWDQPVRDFLPELKGPYADELTLRHLATMRAGLKWEEHYTHAFGITAKVYYAGDIYKRMMNDVPVVERPGERFEYQSGATQLMGMAVEVATGRSLAELASEWLWTPMGAEDDAEWHRDSKGVPINFCCFNSNARDFARFGHVILHTGYWNNHYFLDSGFVQNMQQPEGSDYYGWSIWLGEIEGYKFSYLRGNLGQYVIIIPELNLVIVRLGKQVKGLDAENRVPGLVSQAVRNYIRVLD